MGGRYVEDWRETGISGERLVLLYVALHGITNVDDATCSMFANATLFGCWLPCSY